MSDNFELVYCKDDDVLSINGALFKASKVKEALIKAVGCSSVGSSFSNALYSNGLKLHWVREDHENWFKDGVDCEILNMGSQRWKKGKIKIEFTFDFYIESDEEDEGESILSDLQMIDEEDEQ